MKITTTISFIALLCCVATIGTIEAKCTKVCVAYCSGAAKVRFGKVMKCYEHLPVCKRTGHKQHPWSVSGRKNDYRACRPPKSRRLRHKFVSLKEFGEQRHDTPWTNCNNVLCAMPGSVPLPPICSKGEKPTVSCGCCGCSNSCRRRRIGGRVVNMDEILQEVETERKQKKRKVDWYDPYTYTPPSTWTS